MVTALILCIRTDTIASANVLLENTDHLTALSCISSNIPIIDNTHHQNDSHLSSYFHIICHGSLPQQVTKHTHTHTLRSHGHYDWAFCPSYGSIYRYTIVLLSTGLPCSGLPFSSMRFYPPQELSCSGLMRLILHRSILLGTYFILYGTSIYHKATTGHYTMGL